MSINIPDYPANDGPNVAKQLRNQQAGLSAGAEFIEGRLAAMDDAMGAALDAQAERQNTRDRVRSFVKSAKGTRR